MHVKMKGMFNSVNKALMVIAVFYLLCSTFCYGGSIAKTRIPFEGNASDGTLVIGYKTGLNTNFVSINTSTDESAELAVARLASAIAWSDSIYDYSRVGGQVDREAVAAKIALGATLELMGFPGEYFLAGSQTGLGIPKPPLCLSCFYVTQDGTYHLRWVNPPGEYDCVRIKWRYANSDKGGGDFFPGPPNAYTFKKPSDVNGLDLDVWLMGFRHKMPVEDMLANSIPLGSNAVPSDIAAIHVTSKGHCQEETHEIPFYGGISPNWTPWSTGPEVEKAGFEQGNRYASVAADVHDDLPASHPRGLLSKLLYQVVKAPPEGVTHGTYRKFLGLTPGHTYRLTACVSTLGMESASGNWSFSVHAAPSGSGGKGLTAKQMAGSASLPTDRKGPQAGRIVSYGPGKTTRSDFALAFTGDNPIGGGEIPHIVMPAGMDTLTVWVRFRCSDPEGEVAFSGVKLEDLTAMEEPKRPEEILEEENAAEIRLLKWMQKKAER